MDRRIGSSSRRGIDLGRVYIGTMGWSYEFWRGNFYPQSMNIEDALKEYSKHFNAVEINSSFYRIPSQSMVRNWRDETPEDFVFAAKFPRKVTHIKMLRDCEDDVEVFMKNISQLEEKLGPLLLQFPSSFKANNFKLLGDFLCALPEGYRYAVEVRDKNWFNNELSSLLRDNGIAIALLEHPWLPKIEVLTSGFVYIRWEGDHRKVSGTTGKVERDRTADIEKWAIKIKSLAVEHEVYGFFSKYFSGHPPTDAKLMNSQLRP